MKKFIFCFIFFKFFLVFSQENIKICIENQAKIDVLVSENDFIAAEKIIETILKNCPSANENFYLNAEKTYLNKIEYSNTLIEKLSNIDKIIKVYDLFDKKFQNNNNGNEIKKALYIYDNRPNEKQTVYDILNTLFVKKNIAFNNPRALYIYFELYLNEYKKPKNNTQFHDLIEKYIAIDTKNYQLREAINIELSLLNEKQKTTILSINESAKLKSKQEDLEALNLVRESSKGLISSYLTCENLLNYGQLSFETNKENVFWLNFMASEMFDKSCYYNEIFSKIVNKSEDFKSTSRNNFYLGYVQTLKNDKAKAVMFFNKAADLEKNPTEKSKIFYTISTVVFGINENEKSVEYLKKAIENDANIGNYYLSLVEIYKISSNECAKNDFEKKAIFYLINTLLEKAGKAEKHLRKYADKTINENLAKLPTKQEISKAKMAGKNLTIGCYINETILIPNN